VTDDLETIELCCGLVAIYHLRQPNPSPPPPPPPREPFWQPPWETITPELAWQAPR
jgi:hypothetical protein